MQNLPTWIHCIHLYNILWFRRPPGVQHLVFFFGYRFWKKFLRLLADVCFLRCFAGSRFMPRPGASGFFPFASFAVSLLLSSLCWTAAAWFLIEVLLMMPWARRGLPWEARSHSMTSAAVSSIFFSRVPGMASFDLRSQLILSSLQRLCVISSFSKIYCNTRSE